MVARVLSHVTKDAAEAFVREMVSNKVSLLATDESKVYGGLTDYNHQTVDHSPQAICYWRGSHQYHRGFLVDLQTRRGRHLPQNVSAKYMPLYVAEFQFRYNNRFNSDIFGTAINGC